jgi:hypothetical protein
MGSTVSHRIYDCGFRRELLKSPVLVALFVKQLMDRELGGSGKVPAERVANRPGCQFVIFRILSPLYARQPSDQSSSARIHEEALVSRDRDHDPSSFANPSRSAVSPCHLQASSPSRSNQSHSRPDPDVSTRSCSPRDRLLEQRQWTSHPTKTQRRSKSAPYHLIDAETRDHPHHGHPLRSATSRTRSHLQTATATAMAMA